MFYVSILITVLMVFPRDGTCKKWEARFGKVIYANVLFRHGIRAPFVPYPTDPHQDPSLWPHGYEELTKEGAHQHYKLGQWLGERYAHLLPVHRNYNRSAIYVRSSDIDRTITSAAANMAGMFLLTPEEWWGGVNWKPVPVHTISENADDLIRLSRPCKRHKLELQQFQKSAEYLQMMEKYKSLIDYAAHMSGYNITIQDPRLFATLYVTLLIESLHQLPIPEWARQIFPHEMPELVGICFAITTWTPILKRLFGGHLLNEILETMELKVAGALDPPTRNITVYSGHDTTLAVILNTMGVFNYLIPPFASAVLIELRQVASKEPVVTVFYKNSTRPKDEPILLRLPGCSDACPLSNVRDLWSAMLVEDWEKECKYGGS